MACRMLQLVSHLHRRDRPAKQTLLVVAGQGSETQMLILTDPSFRTAHFPSFKHSVSPVTM